MLFAEYYLRCHQDKERAKAYFLRYLDLGPAVSSLERREVERKLDELD